jgi:hypothetical protein
MTASRSAVFERSSSPRKTSVCCSEQTLSWISSVEAPCLLARSPLETTEVVPSRYFLTMWPATAWDDSDWPDGQSARGWTVMGRLRQRQTAMQRAAAQVRRRRAEDDDGHVAHMLRPVPTRNRWEKSLRTIGEGGPTVLAFLFARPDSDVMESLDVSGAYFNLRTGSTWDLFFPGYFQSHNAYLERQAGSITARGNQFASDWYFSPGDFDRFCREVERESQHRWKYSGDSDLVLVNGWLEPHGLPTIDWQSTMSGQVGAHGQTTLGAVIERMTNDLKTGAEDAHYGVGSVVAPNHSEKQSGTMTNEITIPALLAIAAALGVKVAGIG